MVINFSNLPHQFRCLEVVTLFRLLLKISLNIFLLIYSIGSVYAVPNLNVSVLPMALASTPITYEVRTNSASRIWVVNQDDDSVSVIDTNSNSRTAKITVGNKPSSIAISPNGRIWVSNKTSASISVIDPDQLSISQTITLPIASQPHGIVFSSIENAAFVTLESIGVLLKIDASTGELLSHINVGLNVRHIAITPDGKRLLIARFITPPFHGESTATVDGSTDGAEVVSINPQTMKIIKIIKLHYQDFPESVLLAGGVPNYLGAPAISHDGKIAWIPSKQDHIKGGLIRNGVDLKAENSITAISSTINLITSTEDILKRVNHQYASLASSALYHPDGDYLFVTLESNRAVAVIDVAQGIEVYRFKVGRAPQGMTISPTGDTLYVHNYMDRSVSVIDLTNLSEEITLAENDIIASVEHHEEKLLPNVLTGKQLFYDAADTRLSNNHAISCASCHHDGGTDGRVWDMTGLGEGLRNTISLKGHGTSDKRYFNWSANADERQDIENFIREFSGGTGLMSDSDFFEGTRSLTLGDKKAGFSQDLDDLVSYINSLNQVDTSPFLNRDGTLTSSALLGKQLFINQCMSCHTNHLANTQDIKVAHIGSIKPESGMRLSGELDQIITPLLSDAWQTAPYLHDGSANTIGQAIAAHNNLQLDELEVQSVVDYVLQISGDDHLDAYTPTKSAKLTPNVEGAEIKKSTTGKSSILNVATKIIRKSLEKATNKATPPVVVANQPPSISISSPVNGSSFFGGQTITITNNASDSDGTISKVEFYNGNTLLSTVTTTPFSYTLSNAIVGNYVISAIAYDNTNASTISVPINLVVIPNQPPTVTITTPESNGSFIAGQTITIATKVADDDGSISKVEFYNGDALVSTSTTSPYIHTYNSATVGSYSITAKAFDNVGDATISEPVSFTVANPQTVNPINSLRIYYIGNSVTDIINYGALATRLVENLDVNTVQWGRHMIPGAPLDYIRDNSTDGFMESPYGYWPTALNNYAWDILSLQPFDRQIVASDGSDIGDLDQITNYAQLAAAQNPNTQVYIYARWPRITINNGQGVDFDITDFDPTVPGSGVDASSGQIDDYNVRWNGIYTGGFNNNETANFFQSLVTQVRTTTPFLNKPVLLVPVGYVFADLHQQMQNGNIENYSDIHQIYKDAIHLTEIGSYIVRMTYYATIMKKSPVGLSSENIENLSPAFVQQIQETVWRIVRNHPLAGVKQ
jgi:YVTN family beta-propeller protein